MKTEGPLVLIRGGGDLATGVAARLCRSGFSIVVTEIAQPLALRRLVALAQAVYAGEIEIEDLHGRLAPDVEAARQTLAAGDIPVLVDPTAELRHELMPIALVDGRMRKAPPELGVEAVPFIVGLGPGFTAELDCHAVVETNRGHHLGRVYWQGQAEEDTGRPEPVRGYDVERVLRAPESGVIREALPLGSLAQKGEVLAMIDDVPIEAPFAGALRGLLHPGLEVEFGQKVGDLDPRSNPTFCYQISDKALSIGGGVLEALLSRPEIRRRLGG